MLFLEESPDWVEGVESKKQIHTPECFLLERWGFSPGNEEPRVGFYETLELNRKIRIKETFSVFSSDLKKQM